jgi:hypothetical protein
MIFRYTTKSVIILGCESRWHIKYVKMKSEQGSHWCHSKTIDITFFSLSINRFTHLEKKNHHYEVL